MIASHNPCIDRKMSLQVAAAQLSGAPALPRRQRLAARFHRLARHCSARCDRQASGSMHVPSAPALPASQRAALATTAWALVTLLAAPPAFADDELTPVYFGNGCFWGRQYDFVATELALGRDEGSMSAVAGYAGGRVPAQDGKVCYYRGPPGSVYEELGHAEVVKVDLQGDLEAAKQQYAKFAETYFKQFRKTPFGMMRLDPQDAGPGYRNVIGLPGGVDSPFFPVLEAANVHGMRLVAGQGNAYDARGEAAEGDLFNTVWVLDSNALGFNPAEVYHQYHNGIGAAFPKSYTEDLKRAMLEAGKIGRTGCPDYFFQ